MKNCILIIIFGVSIGVLACFFIYGLTTLPDDFYLEVRRDSGGTPVEVKFSFDGEDLRQYNEGQQASIWFNSATEHYVMRNDCPPNILCEKGFVHRKVYP